jgi:hypothetical protein
VLLIETDPRSLVAGRETCRILSIRFVTVTGGFHPVASAWPSAYNSEGTFRGGKKHDKVQCSMVFCCDFGIGGASGIAGAENDRRNPIRAYR